MTGERRVLVVEAGFLAYFVPMFIHTAIFGNGIQRCLTSVILGLGISPSNLRTKRWD